MRDKLKNMTFGERLIYGMKEALKEALEDSKKKKSNKEG